TTGNVYGIYDMSGGAYEHVMGVMVNTSDIPYSGYNSSGHSGFNGPYTVSGSYTGGIPFPDSKYFDIYSYGTTNDNLEALERRILGDASGEVRRWNTDRTTMVSTESPWALRGSDYNGTVYAGTFSAQAINGGAATDKTFRTVILGG